MTEIIANISKCQVLTPENIAREMLRLAGFFKLPLKPRILENSFGDGVFLKIAVIEIIKACKKNHLDALKIRRILEKNINGYEIDIEKYNKVLHVINEIANNNNIRDVNWSLHNEDFLLSSREQYDLIIGNPPYISYKDLDANQRTILRNNFETCSIGKFDYYYAFIEKSIRSLTKSGKLVYIVPNNISKNVFAKKVRELLNSHISKIVFDFPAQTFKNYSVSPLIFVYDKGTKTNSVKLKSKNTNHTFNIKRINLDNRWILSSQLLNGKDRKKRFGDYYNVFYAIATLSNNTFVISRFKYSDNFVKIGQQTIERNITRPCSSPSTARRNQQPIIIFPYKDDLSNYSESEFEELFPLTWKYLHAKKSVLSKRDSDNKAKWFEYGRSQAIRKMNCNKIMLSSIITKKPVLYHLDCLCIPFSGIIITSKSSDYPLSDVKNILCSDSFFKYVCRIGTKTDGGSFRITSNDIKEYNY